jgi:hypothetical protein
MKVALSLGERRAEEAVLRRQDNRNQQPTMNGL